MADNTTQTGAATIAADDVATLNGAGSTGVLVQRVKVGFGDDGSHRDASTAFPFPVVQAGSIPAGTNNIGSVTLAASGGQTPVAGAITAAGTNTPGTAATASTTGSVVASTALSGNATFHIVATAFVGTLIFEASVDGGLNYAPIIALREDGSGAETTTAISTAVAFIRQYTVALPGLAYFRVRCSVFTSGTAAILIAPGPTLIEPNPSLAASTATIGTVNPQPSTLTATATAALSVAATATLPAVAGQFHYITGISITAYSAAARTGAATPWVVTSTNLPGSPAWTFSTAGAIGATETQTFPLTTPLRSSAVNTATTIVGPAATSVIWRINVTYFTAV